MGAMPYRIAVFDFDGTLVDTSEPIVLGIEAALRSADLPPRSRGDILPLVGLGLERVLERLAGGPGDPARTARMVKAYRTRFDEVVAGRTRPYPGIDEALGRIRERGLALAIATSRSRDSLEALLDAHGLRERFEMLVTAQCVPRTKPAPDMLHRVLAHFGAAPREAVMVGDTTYDLEMGRAAGTATCAVTWGSHGPDVLAPLADRMVHEARDLPAALGAG
jgi:phosphoglycolate phosphatase